MYVELGLEAYETFCIATGNVMILHCIIIFNTGFSIQ